MRQFVKSLAKSILPKKVEYRIPDGQIVYAVGDIHGRVDLLDKLLVQIEADVESHDDLEPTLVFLGDYVDRGWESKAVLDRLTTLNLGRFQTVFLKGNHEEALLSYLDDPAFLGTWRQWGGLETLHSYGLNNLSFQDDPDYLAEVHGRFLEALPDEHLRFLKQLPTYWRCGGYFFAHAGVRPGVSLDQQTDHDLCWIRSEFTNSQTDFGARVVHGHCPEETPQVLANRIGVDTGAYITGHLSMVVLRANQESTFSTME